MNANNIKQGVANTTSKKWLFFDCFGVLIDEPFQDWQKDDSLTSQQVDGLHQTLCDVADFNAITEAEALKNISEIVNQPAQTFLENSWYKKARINTELIEWLKTANKKYHVAMLSNSAPFYLDPFLNQYNLRGLFEKFFISYNMQLAKPDKQIFERALEECQCSPADAIMIDDRAENIHGAESVGMHGIIFKDTENMINKINKIFQGEDEK